MFKWFFSDFELAMDDLAGFTGYFLSTGHNYSSSFHGYRPAGCNELPDDLIFLGCS